MPYDNNNRGVLFQNDKGDNPKRPDYKGEINIEGAEFELAGWKKLGKDNKPFLSLSVKVKEVREKLAEGVATTSENSDSGPLPF